MPVWGRQTLFAMVCLLLPSFLCAQTGARYLSKEDYAGSASRTLKVDTALVRKLYLDGEFERAIAILESDLKANVPFDHGDSVFIFKHLGVMFAARYETRERGKMYMHQLLMTEPTAKIMDMYASDMIYMIFKNIQDEFETNRRRFGQGDTTVPVLTKDNEETGTGTHPKSAGSGSHGHLALWIGAAVVAAGVGGYFLVLALSSSGAQNHNF